MMAKKQKRLLTILACVLVFAAAVYYIRLPWGFPRPVTMEEKALRLHLVETAEGYLGCQESDGSHKKIIDLYNTQATLPREYTVTYEDSWCAAFVSAMAIEADLPILPRECSCQQMIGLFQQSGDWEERDAYVPLPGDILFYDWDEKGLGDSQGWSDHVGIVAGVKWPFIKVIEGNWKDSVRYHYTFIWFPQIRGYGLPNFASIS